MSSSRLGIIDLGSNTFHLLIADIHQDGTWTTGLKDRRYVKLASGGLHRIDEASILRAVSVMQLFAGFCAENKTDHIIAVGTAALREADNARKVIERMEEGSGITVHVIDGQREAHYIWRGIMSCLPPIHGAQLIMDIGGGSVEFILGNQETILFKESYKLGVAVLFKKFHHTDPIDITSIRALETYCLEMLEPLWAVLDNRPDYTLIGASGSFEVIQDAMPHLRSAEHWASLDTTGLLAYLDRAIPMDIATRLLQPEIPEERLDYIVVAYLLIRTLLRRCPPSALYYCEFALKEGIVVDRHDFLD